MPKTPPKGVAAQLAVPVELDDEVTGKCDGEALKAARSRRPTDKRLELLEDKADGFTAGLSRVESAQAVLNAKMDGVSGQISLLAGSVQQLAARDQVAYSARVQVDTARAVTEIGEVADARKARRKFLLTVACTFVSGGGVTWLLHYLGAF